MEDNNTLWKDSFPVHFPFSASKYPSGESIKKRNEGKYGDALVQYDVITNLFS